MILYYDKKFKTSSFSDISKIKIFNLIIIITRLLYVYFEIN